MLKISLVNEQLLASQGGLSSLKLCSEVLEVRGHVTFKDTIP
jgi:hypothetical protein